MLDEVIKSPDKPKDMMIDYETKHMHVRDLLDVGLTTL